MAVKDTVFRYYQPAMVLAILAFWGLGPVAWTGNVTTLLIAGILTKVSNLALEFVNERHASWRLTWREWLTDLFYVGLGYTVLRYAHKHWGDAPVEAIKTSFGYHTPWLEHAPFLIQVALAFALFELGQYWMHRAMHNWYPLWVVHAPHHYVTQLNALKGAVGNPLELFLVGLGILALFDFSTPALLASAHVQIAVASFAHANIRFNPPRWYAHVFTTIEHHSLHHSTDYDATRCNYANCLILWDRVFGTFHDGEAELVGQIETGGTHQRYLSIREVMLYPIAPLFKPLRGVLPPA